MIEGIDFCYIYPKNDATTVHIKFLEGPYKDTVFKYGNQFIQPQILPIRRRTILPPVLLKMHEERAWKNLPTPKC